MGLGEGRGTYIRMGTYNIHKRKTDNISAAKMTHHILTILIIDDNLKIQNIIIVDKIRIIGIILEMTT